MFSQLVWKQNDSQAGIGAAGGRGTVVRSLSVSGRMWQKFSGGESGSGLPSVSSDGPAIDPAKGSHQDPDPPTSMSDTHTHTRTGEGSGMWQ